MKFSSKFGVSLAVIFGFITVKQVQSMDCYNCMTCNDPFDKDANIGNTVACTGSCIKISYDENAVRMCSPISLGDSCDDYEYQGHEASRCSCTSNKCNNSNSAHVSLISTLFLLAAAYLFKRA